MSSEDSDNNIFERGDDLRSAKRKRTNFRDNDTNKKLKLQENKWSLDEKRCLLEAIKNYGHEDYKRISRSVKSRSVHEVKSKIEELSAGVRQSASQEILSDSNFSSASIEKWMDLFQEIMLNEEDFSGLLSQVLGLILRNEKFGESGVPRLHWPNIYRFLLDLAEDRPIPKTLSDVESLVVLDLMNNLRETLNKSDTAEHKRMLELKFALLNVKVRQTNNYTVEKDIVLRVMAQAFANDFSLVEKLQNNEETTLNDQVLLSFKKPKYLALNPVCIPTHLLQFHKQTK